MFNGSVRKDGNTDKVLQKFIEGAKNKGNQIYYKILRELNIGNCKGCYNCRNEATCELKDDMIPIHQQLQECDAMVFASPIYWCEITGLMKTFIDRFYFYHHPNTANLIKDKNVVVISTMGEAENIEYETELINEFYRRFLASTKMKLIHNLILPGIMEAGDILKRPELLNSIYDLGRNLYK